MGTQSCGSSKKSPHESKSMGEQPTIGLDLLRDRVLPLLLA